MKKYLKTELTGIFAMLLFVIALAVSCDLNEKPKSKAEGSTFFKTDAEIEAGLASIYQALGSLPRHTGYWTFQTLSSDNTVIPTRGGDWADGGIPLALHKHTWSPSTAWVNGVWEDLYRGVARANNIINVLNSQANPVALSIAEARTLRAYFYLLLMDLYGNVPVVTDPVLDFKKLPSNNTRAEVFAFVETELKASINDLPATSSSGRLNQNVARAILVDLYLNAKVYSGTAKWDEVISYADAITGYTLMTDIKDNFNAGNSSSTENIWVIKNDPDNNVYNEMNIFFRTSHYNQGKQFSIPGNAGGWNGYCTLADFYDSFDDNDSRKEMFLVGQQTNPDGSNIEDRSGNPLIFTKTIANEANATEGEGIRFNKYDPTGSALGNNTFQNDYVLYRYAEILLAKAEALVRKNGEGDATAVSLLKRITDRASAPAVTATLDNILAERGRELFQEAKRRTDLIRFDKFTDAWEFKAASAATKKLFPIPQAQLDANANLTQNPGY